MRLQFQHLNGIDAGKRLVQQHEIRLQHQRPRDLDAPPLAARKHVAFAVPHRFQTQVVDQVLHALPPLPPAERQRLQNRHQVVFHAELAEDRRLLRQIADAAPRAQIHRQLA